MSTRVLLAFDKFKDAIAAARACAVAAHELRRVHPDWLVDCAPLTDGGDGFCQILTDAAHGEIVRLPAAGPRLERVEAPVGLVEAGRLPAAVRRQLFPDGLGASAQLAVIEMAAVNGLALLAPELRDPWRTTTFGTGQLIRAAAEMGAGAILLGVGGSATSDLGLGALSALGLEFRDDAGAKIRPPFPDLWDRIAHLEGEVFPSIPPIVIATDVSSPLLGPTGAAAVFGPQKGLRPEDLPRLDGLAARLAGLLCRHTSVDEAAAVGARGAGAAGGIAFGLNVAARARVIDGAGLVAAWLDLDARIAAADIVITGEGRFDASTLAGKGPGDVLRRARAMGKRAVVFCGAATGVEATAAGIEVVAITPEGMPLPQALAATDRHLAAAIGQVFT